MFVGSPEDYVALSTFVLEFKKCQKKICLNISIVNDDVLEMVESFTVSLGNTNPNNSIKIGDRFAHLANRISIDPSTAVIYIIDSDGMDCKYVTCCSRLKLFYFAEVNVGLEKTIFLVMEGVGTVEVCVVLYCPTYCSIAFKFAVNLSTIAGTAGMHLSKRFTAKRGSCFDQCVWLPQLHYMTIIQGFFWGICPPLKSFAPLK